jgi:hypothetical protein
MQRVELLLIGLQDHLIKELGLRDIAGLVGRKRARKYLLRLGNCGLHGDERGGYRTLAAKGNRV